MDYHEAKYKTLWKLAFCYSEARDSIVEEDCDFCEVTETNCDKCPPKTICRKYLDMQRGHGISSEQWKYLFDELFELPMPEII